MNVLFLTVARIDDISGRGIYTDLLRHFIKSGHKVYIVSPLERKFRKSTNLTEKEDHAILNVRTLNIQKTNIVEKGIGILVMEYQFERAIKRFFKQIRFDLILYSTPPITLTRIISKIRRRDRARTYLLLKDIFPQNAVDIGLMARSGILYKIFRKKEQKLYRLSDYIGCMSPANVKFILNHNPGVKSETVEVCPNSVELEMDLPVIDKVKIRENFGIPVNSVVFIYGGNLGKPQGLDFLLEVLSSNCHHFDRYFLVVGSGTEYGKISKWFEENKPGNAQLLSTLPKEEYDELVQSCDVGLIFLDPRFTIPNYPSRLLSYLEYKMPVLMATDINTDIGPIAEENSYGFWCENGNLQKFDALVEKLIANPLLRSEMGEKGYVFLKENYTVCKSHEIIMKHFQ